MPSNAHRPAASLVTADGLAIDDSHQLAGSDAHASQQLHTRLVDRTRAYGRFTHQITGVGLAVVTVAALNVDQTTAAAATLGAAWLGSLPPDADQAGARVYRKTLIGRRVSLRALAGRLARLPVRLLALLPHRGLTHSLPACALATLLCGLLVSLAEPRLPLAAAAIGYGTRIAADACTPSGVPVWAPLSRRPAWLLPAPARIRTGSPREYLILMPLTVALRVTIQKLTN